MPPDKVIITPDICIWSIITFSVLRAMLSRFFYKVLYTLDWNIGQKFMEMHLCGLISCWSASDVALLDNSSNFTLLLSIPSDNCLDRAKADFIAAKPLGCDILWSSSNFWAWSALRMSRICFSSSSSFLSFERKSESSFSWALLLRVASASSRICFLAFSRSFFSFSIFLSAGL